MRVFKNGNEVQVSTHDTVDAGSMLHSGSHCLLWEPYSPKFPQSDIPQKVSRFKTSKVKVLTSLAIHWESMEKHGIPHHSTPFHNPPSSESNVDVLSGAQVSS